MIGVHASTAAGTSLGTKIPHAGRKKRKGLITASILQVGATLNGTIHVNNNGLIIITNNNDLTFTNLIFNNNSLILFKDEMHFN